MRFVDTNIALYAVGTLAEDDRKQRISENILASEAESLVISAQVLGEFYTQVTRQSRRAFLSHLEAVAAMDGLKSYHVQPLTLETFDIAMQYRERFGLSYWDCLILAAAKLSGCDAVYSEDMSASQNYDGIQVINPFAAKGQSAQI